LIFGVVAPADEDLGIGVVGVEKFADIFEKLHFVFILLLCKFD